MQITFANSLYYHYKYFFHFYKNLISYIINIYNFQLTFMIKKDLDWIFIEIMFSYMNCIYFWFLINFKIILYKKYIFNINLKLEIIYIHLYIHSNFVLLIIFTESITFINLMNNIYILFLNYLLERSINLC